MVKSNTLMEIFLKNKSTKGIPTLDKRKWKELNQQYDKETIIEALIEYVRIHKPEAPILSITEKEMMDCFFRLKRTDPSKLFLSFDETKERVYEKFDDYGKPYSKHGIGVVQMGNLYLDVSNYFNQTLRLNCDTYGFKSAHHRWNNVEDLRTVFLALWRLGNEKLDEESLVGAFRLSTYIATQFKPHVAKFIYDTVGAKSIFDSSCGWGDRLAGFYCSNATSYYGCDPNPQTFEMYKKQCVMYESLLGTKEPEIVDVKGYFCCLGKKRVEIFRCAAEDFEYDAIFRKWDIGIDCAFTSPPYFSTERYNEGGEHEEDQSWKRYDTYEKWRDNFYLPVNRKTFEYLSEGGIQIVNIQDPKVHNKRYYASDDLINDLTTKYKDCNFVGNLGMRMMQRPKNINKEDLLDLYSKIYIEPCWVFGKNRTSFDMTESGGLLDFLE